MKTIVVDIRWSVFDNDTEASLYVIKDNEGDTDQFIFSIPIMNFCWVAESEEDLDQNLTFALFKNKDRQKRLIEEMKNSMRVLKG